MTAGKGNPKKIVLAYSGGLDTSVILKWLMETYQAEVVCFAADVGQAEELDGLEEKAKNTGASQVFIKDLKEEFARDFIFPAIQSNAIYEMRYLLGTALARPLIAKAMVEVAREVGADAFSHGATGKGNDQVRFELTFKALAPDLQIIAPWRFWDLQSRNALLDWAKKHDIPVPVTAAKPYSMDRNLMHISYEGGKLEDPWFEPDKDMFLLTKDPADAPDEPEYLVVEFERGLPVALNGNKLGPLALMEEANAIAGRHGVGRIDIVENRLVGIKSRGIYETPGGTLLFLAHRDLESVTIDRDTQMMKDDQVGNIARMIYNGLWYSPAMQSALDYVRSTQEPVNGEVRLKLYKGTAQVVGRRAELGLYNPELSTFEEDELYDQNDAEGFINLYGLPLQEAAKAARRRQGK